MNILLTLLIVHYALYLILKPENTTLSCGIFGWFGENPKDFNRDKLDKLGILNEKRGEHSCGISIDGDIFIGVDKTKVYRDFIYNNYEINPVKIPTVIGHTRHATYGAHTVYNAHPFGFGTNTEVDNCFEFIGVHNGTLLNHKDLAKDNDIDLTVKEEKSFRNKIDSEILLEILNKKKDFKVLSKYNGAAAVVFYNTKKPNTVYCYHGKSSLWDGDKVAVEERPLFYYKQAKNSLYISSIEESLEIIGGDEKSIGSFDYNTVYEITNGDVDNAVKHVLTRHGRFQKGVEKKVHTTHTSNYNYQSRIDYSGFNDKDRTNSRVKDKSISEIAHIHKEDERIDQDSYGSSIYFNRLRYWRNGHLIKGVFMWVPKYGFYKLDEDADKAEKSFWNYTNKFFYENDFIYDENNIDVSQAYVPFPVTMTSTPIYEPSFYYFYKGIRMKTRLDYISAMKMDKTNKSWEEDTLSMASAHPIIKFNRNTPFNKQNIVLDYEEFSGIICPLGSENIYTIKKGNCVHIEPKSKKEIVKVETLSKVTIDLDSEIKTLIEKDNQRKKDDALMVIEAELETNDLLEKELEEMFFNNYRDFPRFIKRLEKYEGYNKAKDAIKILEAFIKESTLLIALEKND